MRKFLFAFFVLAFAFWSCKKEEAQPEPEPIPEPTVPVVDTGGWISGKVSLYDAFGNSLTSSSQVSITIEENKLSTQTDSTGYYFFKGVKSGTYTLVYEKAGFGSSKAQGLVYKPGDKGSYNAELAMLPAFTLSSATLKDTTWFTNNIAGMYYRALSSETNTNAAAVAIISNSINPSIENPASYIYDMPVSLLSKTVDYNRFVSYQFLRDNYGSYKTEKLYIKIYPVAKQAGFYTDIKLKRPIYTAHGSALAQTFTITVK